jgi:hypothetical protein
MDFKSILDGLVDTIGQAGVDALSDKFDDLSGDADQPWKATALALLGDAVDAHGMEGIDMARKAIDSLINNEVPEIDWASPRTASDFVAKLQNAEADDKVAARDFAVKVGDTFGQVFAGLIKGLIANA